MPTPGENDYFRKLGDAGMRPSISGPIPIVRLTEFFPASPGLLSSNGVAEGPRLVSAMPIVFRPPSSPSCSIGIPLVSWSCKSRH